MGVPPVGDQAADAPPGMRNVPAPPVAHDAEETMTPPASSTGSPVPDAEKTMTAPPPFQQMAGDPQQNTPFEAVPRPTEPPVPEAERTVTDPPPTGAHPSDARLTGTYQGEEHGSVLTDVQQDAAETTRIDPRDAEHRAALVKLGVRTEGSSAASGPELTPDAILPPGMRPEQPPEPPNDLGGTATGPIPRLASSTAPPGTYDAPSSGAGRKGPSAPRRTLLVGGGLLGVLLVGGAAVLAATELSSGPVKHKVAHSAPPPPPVAPAPPKPSPTHAKRKPKPKPQPVDIRDEKKDPEPLTIGEVFPGHRVTLAGHTFVVAKTVINDHCELTANRPFSEELTRQHCRRVVRATFVSTDHKLAVTVGIAVTPTDAAAAAILKVQDPAHYKWFRGMKATGAPKIDQAGGYATSTMRGRYIPYAYATYADGHKPSAKDKTLKSVGVALRDYAARAIERRAKHH
jgi:hypothetical protein